MMYLVTYDLRIPGRDYSKLYEHLRSYGTCARVLESVWIVQSQSSCTDVRDAIARNLDSSDGLFVIDVTQKVAAWRGLGENTSSWIMNNLR